MASADNTMPLKFDTPGLRMDSGNRYDLGVGPAAQLNPQRKKKMPKFKLELNRKTPEEKVTLGEGHIAAMDGNADFPVANRLPSDAAYLATVNDLKAANADVEAKRTALKQAQENRDAKEAAFDVATNSRASYCEAAQPNNDSALAGTGFSLRGGPAPVGDMPAPTNMRTSMGDKSGEIDLQWDPVYGAGSYIVECREYNPSTGWSQVKLLRQSKHTVTGLTSGKTYAFRVSALGPKGEGPWSDEAVKMAP
jgi:hypothetical protein